MVLIDVADLLFFKLGSCISREIKCFVFQIKCLICNRLLELLIASEKFFSF